MFLPSGRVHAIGAGLVIFEIQQNSDTTYRVYDWGRLGLDGKPRTLHLEQALRCIDFTDFEPALAAPRGTVLVDSPWFIAERCQSNRVHQDRCAGRSFHILCGLQGKGRVRGGAASESFGPGDCLLLPAAMGEYQVVASPQVTFLKVKSP
jgi:mannose-6-phosphate isomerase